MAIPDSIDEGERLHLRAFVRNLTSVPTDSVWVRYALQDGDRQLFEIGRRKYGSFAAKEIKQIELDSNTAALGLPSGEMTLIMEVNPDDAIVEQYHFNNLYYHPIKVRTDLLGPLVDVTVDGKHLMGFDIVSPNPEIVILANDDNRYLPVTVSDSTFRIWFGTERTYNDNAMLTIDNNDHIEKSPVRMPENKTRLTYRPGQLADGEYTFAVQGYDLKGNAASSRPYVIQMKVVNEKSISQVLPYPNPFSTACHFAYTLTGDEKPSRFDVEIYTITGRLVKVVDLLALGDVHFGHNITAYAWDGRDEYGDLLANGDYIYRVNTRFSDAGEVKIIDEETAQFFQNGFGKMYLMR
jgi:flagellar hook assembly protein FlgD